MTQESDLKRHLLYELAQRRKTTRWPGYACIGDYHGGVYECDFVSPYSKTAGNVDSEVLVLLQDWTSDERMNQGIDKDALEYGRTLSLPTNKRLAELLSIHFGLKVADVYATNLFPFIKKGGISTSLPAKDLIRAAREFALPQIEIVNPRLVICLGLNTFNAIRIACGHEAVHPLAAAIEAQFSLNNTKIWCQAHTGNRGQNNRGRDKVIDDWLSMKAEFSGSQFA